MQKMPPSIPTSSSPGLDTGIRLQTTKAPPSRTRPQATKRTAKKKKSKSPPESSLAASTDHQSNQATQDNIATTTNNENTLSPYSNVNTNMMAGGMSYGMYGSPYFGGGMSPMMMGGGPLSGFYQTLFGIQNVVFSLGQAIQLLGMNQQGMQQAFDSLTSMVDHAIATFQEMRALEATENAKETEEQKRRRLRLKAVRWALVMGTSWLVYKIIRQITSKRRRLKHEPHSSWSPRGSSGYTQYGASPYSSYPGASMYGGYGSPGTTLGGMYGYNGGANTGFF